MTDKAIAQGRENLKGALNLCNGLIRRLFGVKTENQVASEASAEEAAELKSRLMALENRVNFLEHRLINYYRNRWDAIDSLADYLVGAQVPGDYFEFGVYKGLTFSYAFKIMAPVFPDMKFVALDSFEGLPDPTGIDLIEGYSSNFHKGQFAFSESEFLESLRQDGLNLERIVTVKGWFHEALEDTARNPSLDKIAAAWIDCDLYESTVPVLKFIGPRLSTGSVLLFDDWGCFRNLPDLGQQRACREWLSANPGLSLHPLFPFSWHGQAFTAEVSGYGSRDQGL